jgi:hypothetical protein
MYAITEDRARRPTRPPRVELEFGAYRDTGFELDFTPPGVTDDTGVHVAQAVILRTGSHLYGERPAGLFCPIPDDWLLEAARSELEYWIGLEAISTNAPRVRTAILNACRARRYALDGVLCSKRQGGRWALGLDNPPHPAAIEAALILQAGGTTEWPAESIIRHLLMWAHAAVGAALGDA